MVLKAYDEVCDINSWHPHNPKSSHVKITD